MKKDGAQTEKDPISPEQLKDTIRSLREEIATVQVDTRSLHKKIQSVESLLNQSPIAIWMIDNDENIVFAKGRAVRELGLNEAEIIGDHAYDIIPQSKIIDDLKPRLYAGEVVERIVKVGEKFFECQAAANFDEDGNPDGIVGLSTDITERTNALVALAQEKERLTVTLTSIGDGVITTDTKAKVISCNNAAEQMTQWKEYDAIGLELELVFSLVEEKSHKRAELQIDVVLEHPQTSPITLDDVILLGASGQQTLICATCTPIQSSDGDVLGAVLVFRDVTHKRIIEEEMHRIEKLESIGLLAGGIAHDFNNILTAALGNISLAKRTAKKLPNATERLADAEKAILRARDLTNQLLTFSKGGSPIRSVTAVGLLIEEATEFSLAGSPVKARFHFDENLWFMEVDPGQISQVIQNLVINAVQAMPEGGTIGINASNETVTSEYNLPLESGQYVLVTLRDQGKGIEPKHLDSVFDPYFTTKKSGTGLGLATAYSILHRHGGHICCESMVDDGTTFSLYLPATTKHASSQLEPIRPSYKGTGRILVMDDEKTVRDVAHSLLEELGFEIEEAINGEEAIEKYQIAQDENRPFDAVIMDLTIPGGMGGAKASQEILEFDPKAKLIVSSGYSNDPIMSQYSKYGFCGVIKKPYGLEQLSRSLYKALDPPKKTAQKSAK